jgi:hypothetical protein
MSDLLQIIENEVQLAALSFLIIVYVLRILWLFRFRSSKEKALPTDVPGRGILHSLGSIAMPWAVESARKNPGFYVQFTVFHLGVTAAITATFIIPYGPGVFRSRIVVLIFQIVIGAAFIVGIIRMLRRIFRPSIRLISTADDYFSLALMIVYFAAAVLAIPNNYERQEWPLILFFSLTAFFLVYVPFSKIGHYLYYPFTRYFLGKMMRHRGVMASSDQTEKQEEHST